jgi:hypothetical protein
MPGPEPWNTATRMRPAHSTLRGFAGRLARASGSNLATAASSAGRGQSSHTRTRLRDRPLRPPCPSNIEIEPPGAACEPGSQHLRLQPPTSRRAGSVESDELSVARLEPRSIARAGARGLAQIPPVGSGRSGLGEVRREPANSRPGGPLGAFWPPPACDLQGRRGAGRARIERRYVQAAVRGGGAPRRRGRTAVSVGLEA